MNKPIYRIIHISNLMHILDSGKICCPNHQDADKEYTSIGLNDLILKRSLKTVPLSKGGTFLEFVSFYFGPRSPMLFKIKTGNGVAQIDQSEIIYLICGTENIAASGLEFVFFDGHANNAFSKPFKDLQDLDQIDWNAVNAEYWYDVPDSDSNFDRQRKKQAEFLIKSEVPLNCITKIATFDQPSFEKVQQLIKNKGLDISVEIDKSLYYL